MSPKVTVSVGSSRPGGIDVLLASLTAQTYDNFEVIFTDGRYHKRHAQVLDAVKASGLKVPFFHVPNHRNQPVWGSSCAGVNTGFMLADGEFVIMLLDYSYCRPNWIEAHLGHHTAPRFVMGPHVYWDLPPVIAKDGWFPHPLDSGDPSMTVENVKAQYEHFDEVCIFPQPFKPQDLEHLNEVGGDPKLGFPTGPLGADYMHTKNESFPTKVILDIGGMDEQYERGRGPGDLEFGNRLQLAGLQGWLARDARVECLNPRRILPNLNGVIPVDHRLPPPYEHRWCYAEGEKYWRDRVAQFRTKSGSPYNMRARREEIWEWRELSQQREPVIPYVMKTDLEYFGSET